MRRHQGLMQGPQTGCQTKRSQKGAVDGCLEDVADQRWFQPSLMVAGAQQGPRSSQLVECQRA